MFVVHADNIARGCPESEVDKPDKSTECEFGQWYESVGKSITNLPSLKKIKKQHNDLHNAYKRIYFKSYDRRTHHKTRKLVSLFRPVEHEVSPLSENFEALKVCYARLCKESKALENQVGVMNEKLFLKERFDKKESVAKG